MRYATLFFALFAFGVLAVATHAQTYGVSKTTSATSEIITVKFPAPADRHFVIFEARLPVMSAQECFDATDFSAAVPAGADRATVSYDPTSGNWFLRNSQTLGSADVGCSVFLVRSSVNTDDMMMFRARFGSTLLNEGRVEAKGESDASSAQRSRVTSVQVTFNSTLNF